MGVSVCLRVCLSVCLSLSLCVCLSVNDHNFGTTRAIFIEFFVRVIYDRGSGFMDDVIFAHKPRLLDVAAQLKRSAHAALGLAINCAQ